MRVKNQDKKNLNNLSLFDFPVILEKQKHMNTNSLLLSHDNTRIVGIFISM